MAPFCHGGGIFPHLALVGLEFRFHGFPEAKGLEKDDEALKESCRKLYPDVKAFLEPANDVGWAGEVLPVLGVGPSAPLWVSLALADWCVKLGLALIALVPFRLIVKRLVADTA